MPPTVADVAARSSAAAVVTQASHFVLKPPSQFVPPAVAAAAAVAGYRYRDAVGEGFRKIAVRGRSDSLKHGSNMLCRSNSAGLPSLSLCKSSNCSNQLQHVAICKEKPLQNLYSTPASLFGDQNTESCKLPKLPRRRLVKPTAAYKAFNSPVYAEKPEWWWRTLACIPYLIALQISDVGFYIQPLVEHYRSLEFLIFFIPGAITRLPHWFSMIYCYFAYLGVVKNKEWPYFIRFHLMMGMLLETFLHVVWYTSNFFPLIHYNGKLGMYYWAGIGFAYMLILLQCVRGALAGGYAYIPFITENAEIHTRFNIGGFQRPW